MTEAVSLLVVGILLGFVLAMYCAACVHLSNSKRPNYGVQGDRHHAATSVRLAKVDGRNVAMEPAV